MPGEDKASCTSKELIIKHLIAIKKLASRSPKLICIAPKYGWLIVWLMDWLVITSDITYWIITTWFVIFVIHVVLWPQASEASEAPESVNPFCIVNWSLGPKALSFRLPFTRSTLSKHVQCCTMIISCERNRIIGLLVRCASAPHLVARLTNVAARCRAGSRMK